MQLTQGLHRAIRMRPQQMATIFRGRRHSYTVMGDRVARLAGVLREFGLTPGGRVAILALNSDRYLELLYAIPWAGGVAVPINTRFAPAEIRYAIEDSDSEILFVDSGTAPLLDRLAPLPGCLRHTVLMAETEEPHHADLPDFETLLAATAPVADAEVGGDALAGIYYTAGTTGQSKGVMLSHRNLVSNAVTVLTGLGFTADCLYLHSAPMFHLADGSSTFAVTLMGGAHTFVPKFDAGDCLATIERERVTNAQFVPTMINLLINHPDVERRDLSSLQMILYGAAPIPESVLRRALTVMRNVRFVHGYGMTETAAVATLLPPRYTTLDDDAAERRRSCGQPGLLVEVRIVDAQDREQPAGTVGEIIIRGPNIMQGYWKKPAATAEALRNGWMHSGDLGYMDAEGFVFLVDRLKDMIKTGGENVFSIEVESIISLLPEVAECAVIGLPDDTWGETVHAIVVPRAGKTIDPAAIIAHCREHIAGYKCPRSIAIRTEPLPLSGTGKVLKSALRAAAREVTTGS